MTTMTTLYRVGTQVFYALVVLSVYITLIILTGMVIHCIICLIKELREDFNIYGLFTIWLFFIMSVALMYAILKITMVGINYIWGGWI